MSLLGIDIGTSRSKVTLFSEGGQVISQESRDTQLKSLAPGWFGWNAADVWFKVKEMIKKITSDHGGESIGAIGVSSFGEALVPVDKERRILDDAIPGFDLRGEEFASAMVQEIGKERLFRLTGNVPGNFYSASKLKWIEQNQPELYQRTHKFLLPASFIYYMLGCDPVVDYSLANRTLLFDVEKRQWSPELLKAAELSGEKLPTLVSPGTDLGGISPSAAQELGLNTDVRAVAGGHDQCCSALGAGVAEPGLAVYGIGTYICITVAHRRPTSLGEFGRGLNIEDHVVPGLNVTFLYNTSGGSVLKWFKDYLAPAETRNNETKGGSVYELLLAEMPEEPTGLLVRPHFALTGPPDFIADSSGSMIGLTLNTTRGEVVKGLLEGVTMYFADNISLLYDAGVEVNSFRATGGGAQSEAWLQLTADIMGIPVVKVGVTEAGTQGAAILAGVGTGIYASPEEAIERVVKTEREFTPDPARNAAYQEKLDKYREMNRRLAGF